MRFVPTKTPEQQSGLMLHRTRHLFIRQQTSVINAIRAHLAEFGVTAPVGRKGMEELLRVIADPSDKRVPTPLSISKNRLLPYSRLMQVPRFQSEQSVGRQRCRTEWRDCAPNQLWQTDPCSMTSRATSPPWLLSDNGPSYVSSELGDWFPRIPMDSYGFLNLESLRRAHSSGAARSETSRFGLPSRDLAARICAASARCAR
jgi:hypothetical protein